VLISGAPGVGKTTIARPLAAELGLPLFAKDAIKQRIHDVLGDPEPVDLTWSRRLGAASMELLWLLAADAPACVLEAAFMPNHEQVHESLLRLSEGGVIVEVHLSCPRDENLRRFAQRGARGERHGVHLDAAFTPDYWDNYLGPVGLGPVIEVDTTGPVDVPHTASLVRDVLAQKSP
jgi:hypothetical protein